MPSTLHCKLNGLSRAINSRFGDPVARCERPRTACRKSKPPIVSIIIKAFNEERHIAGAIESALAALAGIDGEVILADGASTDRTVAIAEKYPIKIVRLNDAADRSCGAGAQLGFQYSRGEFLCLMDGDMRLHRHFLAAGIRLFKRESHGRRRRRRRDQS